LLDVVRGLFVKEYGRDLKKPSMAKLDCSSFGPTFDALVNKLDKTANEQNAHVSENDSVSAAELTPPSSSAGTENGLDEPPPPPPAPGVKRFAQKITAQDTTTETTPIPGTPDVSRPSSPAVNNLLVGKAGPGGKGSRRAKKLASSTAASSADESSRERPAIGSRKSTGKARRKWDADGFAVEDDGDAQLDYSTQSIDASEGALSNVEDVRAEDMGSRTGKGMFVLKDLDDEVDAILAESKSRDTKKEETTGLVGSGFGAISGYFRNVVGGKTLSKEDLEKPLKKLEDHLLTKNVAREAAVRLCEAVERDLVGTKTGNFTSE